MLTPSRTRRIKRQMAATSSLFAAFMLHFVLSAHGFVPSGTRDMSVRNAPPHAPSSTLLFGTSTEGDNDAVAEHKVSAPVEGAAWDAWSESVGISVPKLAVRPPTAEERGKGGVFASAPISALEIVARIPSELVITAEDAPIRAIEAAANANNISWATELTAAAIVALHPEGNDAADPSIVAAKQSWVSSWQAGGWATNVDDLGSPDSQFGPKSVTGSLLSTGSDNDHNVYAKFRFPCHPVIHRASIGLAFLTKADEDDCREALILRGKMYRSMRDALLPLILEPSDERKGSMRERRAWDVADVLSRVLSRVTFLNGGAEIPIPAIVPLYERLEHCTDGRGENVKLIPSDDGKEVLLVATRDIVEDEAIVRDYALAPKLVGDDTEGALRLLLQFGLPPKAW